MTTLWGGIEAGGTKFVCGVSREPPVIDDEIVIPTTTPGETLGRVVAFFQGRGITGLGVGSFGPLALTPGSPAYGSITHTPKEGWQQAPIVEPLAQALRVPVAIDTDVNAALWGEHIHGSLRGFRNAVYVTVGTGIGGGAMVDGVLVHGVDHPEMGHQRVPQPAGDSFPGVCPFHGNCWEGLASGPAMRKRWGIRPEALADHHPGWNLEARLVAGGLANLALILSPERITLGGGIGCRPGFRELVVGHLRVLLAGYVREPSPENLLVSPALGSRAGVVGALELARAAAR